MISDAPQPDGSESKRAALVLVALVGALVSCFTFAEFLFEDSYITLRYATNLAAGRGLVFQPGEAVLGTSSPLWAMLLALPIALGAEPESVLDIGFCASLAGLAYSGGRLLQRLATRRAGVAFAVAVSLGVGRLHAYWGMETPLFIGLLFGAWSFALDRRYARSGLVLGLACLARYEGYVFAAALALALAARGSWEGIRTGGRALAAVTLPWIGLAWLYYGSPIPLPVDSKMGEVSSRFYLERSVLKLPRDLFWPMDGLGYRFPVGLGLAVLMGTFGVVGVWRSIRTRAAVAAALPLGALCVFAILVATAPGPLYVWHRSPLHLIGLVYSLLGLEVCLAGSMNGPRWRIAGVAAVVAGLLGAIPIQLAASARLRGTPQYVGRELAYPEIADFLRETKLNEATVLTWEPGYLAFMSDVRVLDVSGLATPAPAFTRADISRWDSDFPPEADLVLLRAPYRPAGFELVFEGSMGSWLFARLAVAERYSEAIEAYRAGESPRAEARRLSAGPVQISPSYVGPPFVVGPAGTRTRIDPEQQEMRALTAETPLLWIDTPRIEIEFQTSTPGHVQLQLVVRGQVVLSSTASLASPGTTVQWDVSPWIDRTARVRVLAVAGDGAEASFGRVYPSSELLRPDDPLRPRRIPELPAPTTLDSR